MDVLTLFFCLFYCGINMCVYIYISIKGKHHADLEFELEEINLRIKNLCKRQPLAAVPVHNDSFMYSEQ